MEDTILIKKSDGRTISVTATQGKEGIILTKSGDKSIDAHKRKIIIEPMDIEVYKKFINANVEIKQENKFLYYLKRLIK
ncbi:hypothetical protein QWT87_13380 [Chryseobacterium sp. APV1]|uniref:Uncharacterized protein n=1 Tax=Chryseobacterium urinae TaxID=3058400 RepID=A0ABT8U609_9FLAO|nr:hypothetical protein [Chryseobacterium sp. APV1]MDO3425886.1 hypothetical protein [Chryseobacterium sp. APV1]